MSFTSSSIRSLSSIMKFTTAHTHTVEVPSEGGVDVRSGGDPPSESQVAVEARADGIRSLRGVNRSRCLIESATSVRLEIVQITKRRGVAPMGKACSHLSEEERRVIQIEVGNGTGVRKMARLPGRSPSGISREIRRNMWFPSNESES